MEEDLPIPPPPPLPLPTPMNECDVPPPPPPAPDDCWSMTEEETEADRRAMEALGLPTEFSSTKGKKVEGANVSAARVVRKRKYRQYMNRRGGFNRPLDGS